MQLRVVVTVLVVLALGFVGFRAGQRVLQRQADDPERATATEVADAWTAATAAADVERLAELTADRADTDEVRRLHGEALPVLGEGLVVEVTDVATAGNTATATLSWTATPGTPDGTWAWTSELELIRARGVWAADWEPAALHPELRAGWSLAVEQLPPSRAPVLDRLGRSLSRAGESVEVGVQPGRLPERGRLLTTVASVLPEAYDPLTELLERDDLVADWYYPLTTVSAERAEQAWVELVGLPGVIRRDSAAGVGAAVAAPEVVGAVAEDDDGGRSGVSGLEEVFDDRLTGSATTEVVLVGPEGRERATLFEHQSDPAPPLVTTLDRDVQRAVDDAVIAVDDPVGVVVVDPATAGVLAVASRPTTGYARALEGRYPPGVVAGLVPVTAAVTDGAAPTDPLECVDEDTVGGVRVTTRTGSPGGTTTLRDALTGTCDVAVAELGVELGDTAMQEALTTLGIDAAVDLPVPARGWSWPATSSAAGEASAAVGHGRVESSALGVASLAAAVARGAPAPPVVLADEVDEQPSPWPGTLTSTLREVLRRAGDTGPVQVPGVDVAGAVARSGLVGGDPAPATGWWFGFVEGDGPDVALAVVVEGDDGERATVIAERVVRELVG